MTTPARPPGPHINLALAVIGQLFPRRFPFDPLEFGLAIARDFGDIAYYHVGPLHVYQLSHPDFARQILVEEPEKYYKARLIKQAFGPFAGQGLLTSDGELWKRQRKLIQPAFHHSQLTAYGAVMVEHARRLIDSIEDGQVVEIPEEMARLTLAIVVQTLFGADITRESKEVGSLMVAVLDAANDRINSVLRLPSWVPTRRNRDEKRSLRRIDELLDRFIAAHRASAQAPADLLSALLAATDDEGGIGMSDRQLRDEMMTLFLAGHETTAMALTWTCYLLSQHPDVEERLADEVSHVLRERAPAARDLAQLPYTDLVVRESMRLYPPAPGFAREPIQDVRIGGYDVPRGSLVTVNTYAMHRDARFFEHPERFDPDRFAPDREGRIPRYAFLPFGGGSRVCIGNGFAMMEARLILAAMVQRWHFELEPGQQIVPMQLVTVRPKYGMRMRVRARTNRRP